MKSQRALEWIQANRTPPTHVRDIGSAAADVARRAEAKQELPRRVADALGGMVDEEFRAHCRVASVSRGCLTIHVDHEKLVFLIKNRWLLPLKDALPRVCRTVPLTRIVFEYGKDGLRVARPPAREEDNCGK